MLRARNAQVYSFFTIALVLNMINPALDIRRAWSKAFESALGEGGLKGRRAIQQYINKRCGRWLKAYRSAAGGHGTGKSPCI